MLMAYLSVQNEIDHTVSKKCVSFQFNIHFSSKSNTKRQLSAIYIYKQFTQQVLRNEEWYFSNTVLYKGEI